MSGRIKAGLGGPNGPVRALKKEGLSQAAIAKRLGIDPKTVAKYVKANSPPRYRARSTSTRVDKFSGFADKVRQWLQRTPGLSEREVFELLLPEGYSGSERTVNRRIKALRPSEPMERFFEQEYVPGEQSQFDFKEKVTLPFLDGERIVHLHFATLPFSDACFVRGYAFKNYECFIDGIHHFFEELGGMTSNIRFDNLSPCVKKVLKGDERLYTDKFKQAIAHYGFGLLPCRPAKGSDKGDVERDIRTYASRMKNRVSHECLVFKDFDHFNQWAAVFMKQHRSSEVSASLCEETLRLVALPMKEESVLCQVVSTTASSYGSVRLSKSAYSVPDLWIDKKCEVVVSAYFVKIRLVGAKCDAVMHPRMPDGEHSLRLEHILPSLVRKPGAMLRWAHRAILFPQPVCHKFYARLKKLEGFGAEREYLRSINLVLQAPLPEVFAGMELVLESGSEKLFDDLKDLLFGERRPCDVIQITNNYGLKPLKPELSQYDSLIPKEG